MNQGPEVGMSLSINVEGFRERDKGSKNSFGPESKEQRNLDLILHSNIFKTFLIILQQCPTLCNSMDCTLPGSSVICIFILKCIHTLMHFYCLVTKSCPTLCNPMDCSPPGSSVHGDSQVRILEWVVISFSRGSS